MLCGIFVGLVAALPLQPEPMISNGAVVAAALGTQTGHFIAQMDAPDFSIPPQPLSSAPLNQRSNNDGILLS